MEKKETSVDEDIRPRLVQASRGKRLLNYLIDVIIFYIVMIAIGMLINIMAPELFYEIESGPAFNIIDQIVSLLIYALLLGAEEALFKGKTIGKLITGTKAVIEDGSPISARTAFLRGLCRAVPFCVFSALDTPSHPWQDRWTRTYVIDEKQSEQEVYTY